MLFHPFGFLGRIGTGGTGLIGGTDALTVENGHRRLGAFAHGGADFPAQHLVEIHPFAVAAPAPEVMTHIFPRTKVFGQQSLGATRPQQGANAVDDAPLGCQQQRLKVAPLDVDQVGRINNGIHQTIIYCARWSSVVPSQGWFSDTLLTTLHR